MTEPLSPQTIETLAAGYVVGDLDPAEMAVFEQLLQDNSNLRADVAQLRATLDRVARDLNHAEPPAHLRSTILATATTPPLPAPFRRIRVPWQTVIGSVAALLILYLGVENHRLRQDRLMAQDISALLQQPQTQLFSLKPVKAADTPTTGSFVVNLEQRQGILVVQNLAAPTANHVYRLWAIADGEKIPCGTLIPNSQGKVLEKFWMPADFYDTGISGLFVTLELSGAGRYPAGPVVIQSVLPTRS